MNPQFVHLRMHSEYSVTDSTVRLDSAIKKVKEQGVGALGLTDLNNIFGGLIFYTHARKAGVKALMDKLRIHKLVTFKFEQQLLYCIVQNQNRGFHSIPSRLWPH